MKTVGIICECNPMHGGHKYLTECARATGADGVIAVMSGCFVQRGEAAIAEPYLRAEAMVRAGVDAVVELPMPYCAASAEFFADAGVDILSRLGMDELWFGSECGDLAALQRAAEICDSACFQEAYAKTAEDERGTAQAYFETLCALCGDDAPVSPNDILGIAYLRAVRRQHSQMRPVTVKREGSGYREQALSPDGYPSATALRARWQEDGVESILPLLPAECQAVYAKAGAPMSWRNAERLILGHLRLSHAETLGGIAELSGGLGNRLQQAARRAQTLDELLALAATKKYPTARLWRGILFSLSGVTPDDLRTPPAYTRLLAATPHGCRLLAEGRHTRTVAVVTRKGDLPQTKHAARQAELEARAWDLYGLCRADGTVFPSPWQRNPVIVE